MARKNPRPTKDQRLAAAMMARIAESNMKFYLYEATSALSAAARSFAQADPQVDAEAVEDLLAMAAQAMANAVGWASR